MDELDEEEYLGSFAVLPAADLAWSMFMQSGYPGLYMLYRDLNDKDDRSPLD